MPSEPPRATERALTTAGAVVLLATPGVLAFFTGGFYDQPRLTAAIVLWVLVAALALVRGSGALPRIRAARAALAGLALLAALAALSLAWAPLAGPAQDDYQRDLLYLAALWAGILAFRERAALRAVEPALALTAAGVLGYGLSERLAPGLVSLDVSGSARGRLEQPLTYWNAMGVLGAMGLVLCARLAGDGSRPRAIRGAAAAAAPLVGLGIYLTFSRGAYLALAAGVVTLILVAPHLGELRGSGIALGGGALAAAAAELLGLESLQRAEPADAGEGLVMLAVLAVLAVAAALLVIRRGHGPPRPRTLTPRWRAGLAAALVILIAAGVALAGAGTEDRSADRTTGAGRLATVESNRYDYWEVAAGSFADSPLVGAGSGAFRVEWLRERDIRERVDDAHSLYLETAAELGLAGLACLALLFAGVAAGARRALRSDRALAAGPAALTVAFAVHAGIDWDWEMPAVTLVAVVAAAALLAAGEAAAEPGG